MGTIDAKKLNFRTGLVYMGAACLIGVVGVRTLLQTADEGFTTMSYITMVALGFEISLLFFYARTIQQMDTSDKPMKLSLDTSAFENMFQSVNIDVTPLVEQIGQLKETNEDLKASLNEFKESQSKNIETLETQSSSLVKLSDNIETLVNEEVKRKVHEAISSLLASKLD